jgi:hypothetical protein
MNLSETIDGLKIIQKGAEKINVGIPLGRKSPPMNNNSNPGLIIHSSQM